MTSPVVPLKWTALCEADAVPEGKGVLVRHGKLELLIFHRPDGWTAFDNTCPHAGAPIFAEHYDGECVTCVYHGLRFRSSDGACPEATGWTLEPFPVKVEDGDVLVGFKDFGP